MPQGTDRHMQQLGCPGLIAARLSEGLDNIGLFEVLEMAHEVDTSLRQIELGTYPLRIVVGYIVGQSFRLYLRGALKRNRTFDGVFKLSNVAMPGIILKQLSSPRRDRKFLACLFTKLSYEVLYKVRN